MMSKRKSKKKLKSDDIDVMTHFDDLIKDLMYRMIEASKADIILNKENKPAPNKLMMLNEVKSMLLSKERYEQLIENGFFGCVAEWLSPLPSQDLPSIKIRTTLITILYDYYKDLDIATLKASRLGKKIAFLSNHPKEEYDNKKYARKLVRIWMRPIFLLELEEKERILKETKRNQAYDESVKRRRLSNEPTIESETSRARVPQYVARVYLQNPSSEVDVIQVPKCDSNSQYKKLSQKFQERIKKDKKNDSLIKVSIEGRKL
uniref:TFIIS N-terminal domain-containing protein n=1 Tax=Parastrongyloides trichosuri TaxID=131310 RepID=A0A0N4ZHV3_PARTI